MGAEFDALGIKRVGLSTDTVEQAAMLREKLDLHMRLLADPALKVVDQYNLRAPDGRTPIVTTVFITADGIVRWIDQSPSYKTRTPGPDVLARVKGILEKQTAAPEAQATAAHERVTVVLLDVGERPVPVLKALRAITGLGLADVKALADGAPRTVKADLTRAEAEAIKQQLEQAGAQVDIR